MYRQLNFKQVLHELIRFRIDVTGPLDTNSMQLVVGHASSSITTPGDVFTAARTGPSSR